jgi:TRAP-type C4-dicarboxylate transport system permease small subunit
MKKFLSVTEKISEWIVGLAMFTVTAAMTMQVIFRYILNWPLAWTDSMTKFAFVWCVFFGTFIGIRKKMHIALDMLAEKFPPRLRLASALAVNAMIIAILAISAFYGFQLFKTSLTSTLPAVNIPLGYIYLPFVITSLLSIVSFMDLSLDAIRKTGEAAND